MHKPDVSIVLPVYNDEKTLNLCLDSLTGKGSPVGASYLCYKKSKMILKLKF